MNKSNPGRKESIIILLLAVYGLGKSGQEFQAGVDAEATEECGLFLLMSAF